MDADRHVQVLAVGIDSAEPTLVRDLIDRGELPALARLLDRGRWALVDSRADIGSGAVWPTFFTGNDPIEHQMYSGWNWDPREMRCTAPDEARLTPFWRSVAQRGVGIGVLDVPWAPVGPEQAGFEIAEFGPHDVSYGELRTWGAESIPADTPRHPFYGLPHGPGYADDLEGKRRLSAACVEGARARGELAAGLLSKAAPELGIVVFSEVHHTTHQLWHTVAPDDPMYAAGVERSSVKPDLVDLYREVDRQIGRMVEAAGPETAVMAFSLHGMRAGLGIPMVHERLLERLHFAVPSRWRGLSWRERGASVFATAKSHAPGWAKTVYHRKASYDARRRLAQPTIVPPHDWSRTRVFSLPTDQRPFLRVNLAGREARGVVHAGDYRSTCDEVEDALRAARTADGKALVADVMRPAGESGSPPEHLPDIIVDWTEAAFRDPVRVVARGHQFEAHPIRTDMTGQHDRLGFCIVDERLGADVGGETIAGTELHRLLLAPFGAELTSAQR